MAARAIALVVLSWCCAAATASEAPATTWQLVLLKEAAVNDGAVCIDGSPAAVYVKPGVGDKARRFILLWEGGGWCESLEGECRHVALLIGRQGRVLGLELRDLNVAWSCAMTSWGARRPLSLADTPRLISQTATSAQRLR